MTETAQKTWHPASTTIGVTRGEGTMMTATTTNLSEYYHRLYEVIMSDVDLQLTATDPEKRVPKAIFDKLELADKCQKRLQELGTPTEEDTWEATLGRLSADTRTRVEELTKQIDDLIAGDDLATRR